MHHLLPSPKSTCYNLRTLGHGLSVNPIKSKLHKNTFITRLIFDDCYRFFALLRLYCVSLCLFAFISFLYVFIFVLLFVFYVLVLSYHAFDVIVLYTVLNK